MRGVAAGLGAHAATLIRVQAERTSEVPSGVGDVLGKLGDEVQGIEDLDVACHIAEEVTADGPGEASAGFLFGEVDHGALPGDSGSGARG